MGNCGPMSFIVQGARDQFHWLFSIAGYCIQHRCDIFDFKELIVNFVKMHQAFDSFAFKNIVRCLPIIYIVIQLRWGFWLVNSNLLWKSENNTKGIHHDSNLSAVHSLFWAPKVDANIWAWIEKTKKQKQTCSKLPYLKGLHGNWVQTVMFDTLKPSVKDGGRGQINHSNYHYRNNYADELLFESLEGFVSSAGFNAHSLLCDARSNRCHSSPTVFWHCRRHQAKFGNGRWGTWNNLYFFISEKFQVLKFVWHSETLQVVKSVWHSLLCTRVK